MQKSYRFMLLAAAMFVALSIVGWLTEPVIPLEGFWIICKLSAFGAKLGGLGLAGLCVIFAGLNWLGSRTNFRIKRESLPALLFMTGGFALIIGLFVAMIGGAMSTMGAVGLYGAFFGGFGLIALAFFIRGMIPDKPMEQLVDEARREEWISLPR